MLVYNSLQRIYQGGLGTGTATFLRKRSSYIHIIHEWRSFIHAIHCNWALDASMKLVILGSRNLRIMAFLQLSGFHQSLLAKYIIYIFTNFLWSSTTLWYLTNWHDSNGSNQAKKLECRYHTASPLVGKITCLSLGGQHLPNQLYTTRKKIARQTIK